MGMNCVVHTTSGSFLILAVGKLKQVPRAWGGEGGGGGKELQTMRANILQILSAHYTLCPPGDSVCNV